MKKTLTFIFAILLICVNAQQDEYTVYLQNARNALLEKNYNGFITNFTYFSTALEKEKIEPQDLSDTNLELYTLCLNDAVISSMVFPDKIAQQAVQFLHHEKDKNPIYISNLAYMYYNGFGVGVDYEKAFSLYKTAAENGNSYSIGIVGNMYLSGMGVSKNYNQAINWYEKGIAQNDAYSMRSLGYMFQHGYGVSKNLNEALKYYQMAVNNGSTMAFGDIGELNKNEGNIDQAIQYFQKGIDANDAFSIFSMGHLYFEGKFVNQDFNKAFHYFESSSNLNSLEATMFLAQMYEEGLNVNQNIKKALELYEYLAQKGYVDAMRYLGYLYSGATENVSKNVEKAKYWYSEGIMRKDPGSAVNMSYMYKMGDGVEKNYQIAVNILYKSLEFNSEFNPRANYHLGTIFLEGGFGIEKNKDLATKFLEKSCVQNDQQACNLLVSTN